MNEPLSSSRRTKFEKSRHVEIHLLGSAPIQGEIVDIASRGIVIRIVEAKDLQPGKHLGVVYQNCKPILAVVKQLSRGETDWRLTIEWWDPRLTDRAKI